MTDTITFTSSLTPFNFNTFFSPLHTGLIPTRTQALTVIHHGMHRDFSRIEDPRSITFEDVRFAVRAFQQKNDQPMIAILNAFHDQILGRVSQFWMDQCDQSKLVRSAYLGLLLVILPFNRIQTSRDFYQIAIEQIERRMDRSYRAMIERSYLSLETEAVRNLVHEHVVAFRRAGRRHPEFSSAQHLDIPYLRVVQLMSLAGKANPDGPMPASDAYRMKAYFNQWKRGGEKIVAMD